MGPLKEAPFRLLREDGELKAVLVAGGPEADLASIEEFVKESVCWIGIDRGTLYLLNRGIKPEVAFGDFDSVAESEWQQIQQEVKHIREFPSVKNETDLELALQWVLKQQPEEVIILGATGGRLDHFFGTVSLLMNSFIISSKAKIEIVDQVNRLSVYRPGEHAILRDERYKYVSFFSLSERVTGFSLKGFKYPLDNHTIESGSTLYVSNELVGESGTFSFAKGILMVIRSTDD